MPANEGYAPGQATGLSRASSAETYRDSCILLEPQRYFLAIKGVPLKLSRTQFRIAASLIANINGITRFEDLWTSAWNQSGPANRKNIQVMMSRVREKFERSGLRIESVVDVGYILFHDRCCRDKR